MKKFKRRTESISNLEHGIKTMYSNKYYNLFMNSVKWNGLYPEQVDYIMRKFWSQGTVCAFKIKNTGDICFADYAVAGYNIYDFPAYVNLINKYGVPFIPTEIQTVNEDVVIGWSQANHKPIRQIVDCYIDRIVQVELALNTNLQLQKMPFMIGVSPEDVAKAQDIIERILANEVAVFADLDDLNAVKSFVFNAPYIVDKLYSYKTSLENELLTFLGLDNVIAQAKERFIVDEVNANNQVINANQECMLINFRNFTQEIQDVLGITISVEPTRKPVTSVYEKNANEKEGDNNDEE